MPMIRNHQSRTFDGDGIFVVVHDPWRYTSHKGNVCRIDMVRKDIVHRITWMDIILITIIINYKSIYNTRRDIS